MISGDIPAYWKLPILLLSLTPNLTPTEVSSGRHTSTRIPQKSGPQGILRHDPTPEYPLASLEQNPAYGTALTFMYANYAR
jgi:hypothetical protein